MPYSRRMNRSATLLSCFLLLAGCAAQGNSFERHSLSRLSEVSGSAVEFEFETRAVPGFERDDPEAEAVRMQWLTEWLAVRGACKSGYEVTERRQLELSTYNDYQSEFHYLVRCRVNQDT